MAVKKKHRPATGPINAIANTRVMALRDLVGADYNPRRISPEAMQGLDASLRRYGLVEPIVWNERSRNVVGGHQRLEVLRRAGVAEATVTVVDLDEKDERALNVTLNNPKIMGEFTDGLDALIEELAAQDAELTSALLLDELRTPVEIEEDVDLTPLEVKPAPSMTWVLVGIPTVRFGEIAAEVERVTKLDDVICEVTANGD